METPLKKFLDKCYADFTDEKTGCVADYIPELTRANPDHFGISVATIDLKARGEFLHSIS
jgi:glutaminase